MTITFDLAGLKEKTNSAYLPAYKCRSRFLILYGGAGSGKSVFACHKILYRILTERNHKILVVRKVAATIRNTVFDEVRTAIAYFGLSEYCTVNKTDMSIVFPYFRSSIIFAGCDNVEKLKSLSGITSIWIEEATELSEMDLNQLNLRLRGKSIKNYKQIMLTFNPISAGHWLKRRFFDNTSNADGSKRDDVTIIKTTYRDNKYLDDEYTKELARMQAHDETYFAIYANGDWGELRGLIFNQWEAVDTLPESFDAMYYGLDFGFNDPSCYLEVGVKDQTIYIVKEIYRKNLTNTELIAILAPMIPKCAIVTCDSAEPARIAEFNRSGVNAISAVKGPSSIRDGIDFLKSKTIKIASNCVNTIREFQMYKWREDKDGNCMDEPVGINDHAIAALRYAIEPMRFAISQSFDQSAIVRGPRRDVW